MITSNIYFLYSNNMMVSEALFVKRQQVDNTSALWFFFFWFILILCSDTKKHMNVQTNNLQYIKKNFIKP